MFKGVLVRSLWLCLCEGYGNTVLVLLDTEYFFEQYDYEDFPSSK